MIEFILSKFGILLFAVAVAGILVMFAADMKDIFISDEGIQLSSVITRQLKEMADSPSLCVSTFVSLPKYIDVIGSTNVVTSTSLFYNLDINVVSDNTSSSNRKFVVFALTNKKNGKLLSVESFMTEDDVSFQGLPPSSGVNPSYSDGLTYAHIDPTEKRILYLVKISRPSTPDDSTTKPVIKKLIFVPCTYEKNDPTNPMKSCFTELRRIALGEDAFCLPTSNPYEYKGISSNEPV